MIDYSKGKIYKLISLHTNQIYIGSTCQSLSKRLGEHKKTFNAWKNRKYGYVTSFSLFELGNVQIILMELIQCCSKEELTSRERYHIERLECLNKIIPGRTPKEYREANKDKIYKQKKEYRETNREQIKQHRKEYYQNNKDKIQEYYETNKEKIIQYQTDYNLANNEKIKQHQKEYRETNKEKIKEYYETNREQIKQHQKEYRETNKEKINEYGGNQIFCCCGSELRRDKKANHERTKKHERQIVELLSYFD